MVENSETATRFFSPASQEIDALVEDLARDG